jgi:IMP dehydrogenase
MLSNVRGLTFDDVMLVPGYNGIRSRQDVTTSVTVSGRKFEIPIISANMDTVTEVTMADAITSFGGMSILHRFMTIDENVAMFRRLKHPKQTGISIGIGEESMPRAEALVSAGAEIICVDVAHGHSKEVNRTIRQLRDRWGGNIVIIAGNVATYAGADYLAAAGADVIKVGIGPGSVCSTRIKTGFGVPQLTALQECRKVDRCIIADGGIKTPGDAVKALAAGADFIMMGGMAEWKTSEGVAVEVPAKGPVRHVILDVMGGIRSGMTYCGALNIKQLQRKAQFMEITPAAFHEGTPHASGRLTR